MSELIDTAPNRSFRHTLMATASVATLLSVIFASEVRASTTDDSPTIWVEIGGQLDRVDSQRESYTPPFAILGQQHGLSPLQDLQSAPNYSVGENGSISFRPKASDWSFSASIQYGRSNKSRYRHEQNAVTAVAPFATQHVSGPNGFQFLSQTSDYTVKSSGSHTVVDFKVGKDVGLGWKDSMSNKIELGVRFAQFISHTSMDLHAIPYPHLGNLQYFSPIHGSIYFTQFYQIDRAKPKVGRNFHGWGPTLSWSGALPVVKSDDDDARVSFDFGANVGVLFGRQKVLIEHHTTGDSVVHRPLGPLTGQPKYSRYHYVSSINAGRSRFVAVPNIGALAGLSLKLSNAKVSLGYRADFFFGAVDGGVNTSHSENRNFYGPFATVSIGLGG